MTTHADVISPIDVARKLPDLLPRLPRMVQGLLLANNTSNDKTVGLAWAFEQAVRENPQGVAILYRDVSFTYSEFNQWANRLAHVFLRQGLKKGDVATVLIENRPELLVTALALSKIGVIAALVNTSQTGKVLTHSINLVKPSVLVTGAECAANVMDVRADLLLSDSQLFWLDDADCSQHAGQAPEGLRNLAEEAVASPGYNPPTAQHIHRLDGLFYIYTSGTTGLPKAAVFNNGRWMKAYGGLGFSLGLGRDDVLYSTLPLYHATAMVVCWGAVIAGRSGLAIRRKFSASEFWDDCRKYKATAFGYVGELCRYLLEKPAGEGDRAHAVRKMVGNGLRPSIWRQFKERFGIEVVAELYGSSEGNVGFSNIFNFDNTVGFSPVPYAIVKYDKEAEAPVRDRKGRMIKVKQGEVGLMIGEISDKTPFDGYTDSGKNVSCIFTDVFKKGDRYFNTGDLMRDIGFRHAQFVDRTGDTFRWKGENVSTTEVENIMTGHHSLAEAVVYGVEIPNTNGRAGMAAITPHAGHTVDFSNLATYLRRELPPYAVPVFLRVKAAMETTGTFKYQKSGLKQEGFDPSLCGDEPLFVMLPGNSDFVPLDAAVHADILAGKFRF
ncbi:long-chain-acyl-CoA synthetase [Perlucidibaca piscinae]|uniref:long-chain-acyl-CoA synthetase n=1 Tax=Perlucidibaca piscinae TaxID=392589 RepID=UPI0003B364FE|nr:long-chain-acyl-CoA synthetase [Perlucidibaca piscinae]